LPLPRRFAAAILAAIAAIILRLLSATPLCRRHLFAAAPFSIFYAPFQYFSAAGADCRLIRFRRCFLDASLIIFSLSITPPFSMLLRIRYAAMLMLDAAIVIFH